MVVMCMSERATYNIKPISCCNSEIVLRVTQITIPENKAWQGFIGVFCFKFNSDYAGSTTVILSSEGEWNYK